MIHVIGMDDVIMEVMAVVPNMEFCESVTNRHNSNSQQKIKIEINTITNGIKIKQLITIATFYI